MRDHKHVNSLNEFYGITDETERRNTMIAKIIIEGEKIKRVSYLPCYVNEKSEPVPRKRSEPLGRGVFNYMKDISAREKLPVRNRWEGDEVLVLPQGAGRVTG
jgi:hypothetical protein